MTAKVTSVDTSSGMQALCHSLGNACHKYEMGTNEGLFVVFVCLFCGYTGGCSIVKTIRGWVLSPPTQFFTHFIACFTYSLLLGCKQPH